MEVFDKYPADCLLYKADAEARADGWVEKDTPSPFGFTGNGKSSACKKYFLIIYSFLYSVLPIKVLSIPHQRWKPR